ncbi:MAG: TolC family protein [Bacteroidales bacterium]
MKKQMILYLLLLFSSISLRAQNETKMKAFTLKEAIDYALVENYGQQILQISREGSLEDIAQSKRDLLPDLQGSVSQSFSNNGNNGSYNLNTSLALWKGGQQMNAIKRAKVVYRQSDSKMTQAQNELMINIIQAFLSVIMNEELREYQKSVASISKEMMHQGEIRYKAGEILESDYLLLQAQYTSDSYALTNSEINRNNALLDLKKLLSIDPVVPVSVVHPNTFSLENLELPPLSTVIEQTISWLPDLQITEQNINLAQLDVRIAKGNYSPTLSLNGSIGTNYNGSADGSWSSQFGDNNLQQISLSVSIPLWNKGKTRSNVKQANFRLQQAKLEDAQAELNLVTSLEKEYLNVVSLSEKYQAAKVSNEAYAENFRVFTTKFDKGAVSTTDLLQQQNTYLNALNNYIQSKYSFWFNRKMIDVYMGNEINN